MIQAQKLGNGIRYKLEILHLCGERAKTKSQGVLGANSYICRSYRGKTGRGPFYPPPILNKVKQCCRFRYHLYLNKKHFGMAKQLFIF